MVLEISLYMLREGLKETGQEAQFNNIAAAKAVADAVRSTLGPKGMDKMLVNTIGDVVITNDGVTILKEIDVQHPAAKMLVEVAKTQDAECGDGTTTSVVIAGELLKQSEELINSNVHSTVITNGFRLAAEKAAEILDEIAVPVNTDELLEKVASTALTGKAVGEEEAKLAKIVVQACRSVEDDGKVDTDDIHIQKKIGENIGNTCMIKGIVIDKERVHPRMPKKVENAKIALFSSRSRSRRPSSSTDTDHRPHEMTPSSRRRRTASRRCEQHKEVRSYVVSPRRIDDLAQHYLARRASSLQDSAERLEAIAESDRCER